MLSVGDVIYGSPVPLHMPPTHPTIDFLERHPTVESPYLYGHPTVNPLDPEALDTGALPALSESSGSLDHLRALLERGQPNAGNGNALWAFKTEPINGFTIKFATRENPDTRLLSRADAAAAYDSTEVLRTIVVSCSQLLNLDLSCTCKPSFFLIRPSSNPQLRESFSRSPHKLARLRMLQLTTVRQSGREPMHVGAMRITLSNTRITHFSISYIIPAHTPALPRPASPEKGSFKLVCN
ncbi:hypothetical protein WOLCODRAFT_167075 [Wolfiporia cocos MD-104 SS10]|uniref:Uncharacterized protein n=1 Tax=Wolfiporia cocos (strain MD-104) TaxID=742152 RepID=A0A2H3JL15_WOLCO|nr:hypothetical protein WOLCODRAFT_167075 [Wolfiporia cocos MD-104 SS10]